MTPGPRTSPRYRATKRRAEPPTDPNQRVIAGLRRLDALAESLTMPHRETIEAWIRARAELAATRLTGRAKARLTAIAELDIVHAGESRILFRMFKRGRKPSPHLVELAIRLALGHWVFRVRRSVNVYRPLYEGMVGAISHWDPYGCSDSDLEWGLDFLEGTNGNAGHNTLVPLECIEPAEIDDLERDVAQRQPLPPWNRRYGGCGGQFKRVARALWFSMHDDPEAARAALRDTATQSLETLSEAIASALLAVNFAAAGALDLKSLRRTGAVLSGALGHVSVYPDDVDLALRYQRLLAESRGLQRALSRAGQVLERPHVAAQPESFDSNEQGLLRHRTLG